jgi:uncharacterized protein YndB with AHSA1/START domain
MTPPKITVTATINAPQHIVWECYTLPEHIVHWNFAGDDWRCPWATNDMAVGGRYVARMEARDGSFGFDFDATYTAISPGHGFSYQFGDRYATAELRELTGSEPAQTQLTITFDPEDIHPIEFQQQGWQAILDRFKRYVEEK